MLEDCCADAAELDDDGDVVVEFAIVVLVAEVDDASVFDGVVVVLEDAVAEDELAVVAAGVVACVLDEEDEDADADAVEGDGDGAAELDW